LPQPWDGWTSRGAVRHVDGNRLTEFVRTNHEIATVPD